MHGTGPCNVRQAAKEVFGTSALGNAYVLLTEAGMPVDNQRHMRQLNELGRRKRRRSRPWARRVRPRLPGIMAT